MQNARTDDPTMHSSPSQDGRLNPPSEPSTVAHENIHAVVSLERQAEERRTRWQRLSDGVASLAAHESTVVWHFIFFGGWIAVNADLLSLRAFDPFPFRLLTTIVSFEALFLTLFVLASQNRLRQDADRRAHLDLQVNLLAEQEMTLMLHMLREVCEHHGLRETIQSHKFRELAKLTDLEQLAEHLERTIASPGDSR